MSLEQIDVLLSRIKVHRPFFMKDMKKDDQVLLKKEWYKILINYDNIEVNEELDKYFSDLDNDNKNPTVYSLISNLSKVSDKQINDDVRVYCQICGADINLKNYQEHYDHCSSIEYLSKMAFKYLNMKLRKDDLRNLNNKDFEKLYWDCCNCLLKKIEDPIELHFLKNSIAAHEGQEINLDLGQIISMMSDKQERSKHV